MAENDDFSKHLIAREKKKKLSEIDPIFIPTPRAL